MSAQASTEAHPVEHSAICAATVESRGWILSRLPVSTELDLREQLLDLAIRLGTPVATRSGGGLCDALSPMQAAEARARSLSKIHEVGEFPFHNDTAHWHTPCRYLILACVSPGSASRPTFLMDTGRLPLNTQQYLLLHSTPLRVTNGRNSFFSTILAKGRPFVRFDRGCMTAVTSGGGEALAVLDRRNWLDYVEAVPWEAGKVLVMDNWRMLHGRGGADCPDADRRMLRISIR